MENEAFLFAIKDRKNGRTCWRWVVRDFLKISRKSRTNQRKINGALFLGPNRGYGFPIFGVISVPISRWANSDKNDAFLFAIMGRKEGRPDWRWIAHDFVKVCRKSWANRWELPGTSARPLIATKDSLFWCNFQPDSRSAKMR